MCAFVYRTLFISGVLFVSNKAMELDPVKVITNYVGGPQLLTVTAMHAHFSKNNPIVISFIYHIQEGKTPCVSQKEIRQTFRGLIKKIHESSYASLLKNKEVSAALLDYTTAWNQKSTLFFKDHTQVTVVDDIIQGIKPVSSS